MSDLTATAKEIADEIGTALRLTGSQVKATHDITLATPPCVLVSPVPRRQYDRLDGGFEATWGIYVISPGQGTLQNAAFLNSTTDLVLAVLKTVETCEPVSYAGPSGEEPRAAYLLTFKTDEDP